jgi:mono/diheme cytochrome c family protein
MRTLKVTLFATFCTAVFAAAPAVAGDAQAGQSKFQTLCATCHGQTGRGDGPAAAALRPQPRDMSDDEWQESVDDDFLRTVIRNGGTAVGLSPMMTPFGHALNDEEIENVVAYIRTLDDGD